MGASAQLIEDIVHDISHRRYNHSTRSSVKLRMLDDQFSLRKISKEDFLAAEHCDQGLKQSKVWTHTTTK